MNRSDRRKVLECGGCDTAPIHWFTTSFLVRASQRHPFSTSFLSKRHPRPSQYQKRPITLEKYSFKSCSPSLLFMVSTTLRLPKAGIFR